MEHAESMSQLACNGCGACCKGDLICLKPHLGDDPAIYQTVTLPSGEIILAHAPNGDCIYLGPNGCDNYENRPFVCRQFDCRKFYALLSKKEREQLVKLGAISIEVIEAGRRRLATLAHDELMTLNDQRVRYRS